MQDQVVVLFVLVEECRVLLLHRLILLGPLSIVLGQYEYFALKLTQQELLFCFSADSDISQPRLNGLGIFVPLPENSLRVFFDLPLVQECVQYLPRYHYRFLTVEMVEESQNTKN